jgi:hypothetical protein
LATSGVVFLGTPHRGSKLQPWGSIVADILGTFGYDSHKGILDDLKFDSPKLRDLLREFSIIANRLQIVIYCFFELFDTDFGQRFQIPGLITGMVVDEASACIDGHQQLSLELDHIQLNKFGLPDDRNYMKVSGALRAISDQAQMQISRRLNPVPPVQNQEQFDVEKPEGKALMRALYQSDPSDRKTEIEQLKGGRVHGTCKWILARSEFTTWLNFKEMRGEQESCSALLWLHAGPGCGKTMIATFLVDEILQLAGTMEKASVLYFFCEPAQDGRSILRGLLLQLLQQHPDLLKHILPKFEIQGSNLFESLPALWLAFISMVKDPLCGSTYCIIDGLDECEEKSQKGFLDQLTRLVDPEDKISKDINDLKILILSRQTIIINERLKQFPQMALSGFQESRDDVKLFVTKKVEKLARRKSYSEELAEAISQCLIGKAEGIFLWVALACEDLDNVSAAHSMQMLELFPKGLEDIYSRILNQVKPEHFEQVKLILEWVSVERRASSGEPRLESLVLESLVGSWRPGVRQQHSLREPQLSPRFYIQLHSQLPFSS